MTPVVVAADLRRTRDYSSKPFVWKLPVRRLRDPWCVMWVQPGGKVFRAAERSRFFRSWGDAYAFAYRVARTNLQETTS